ncbi:hypothetical protein [Metabacillus fastidiosus]|uniref:Uncharacterized protein n=1 Tax=Metabacillus fastidiosus TaxID=1458 RepID=A0ABU6P0G1_9BACI|nr:hypothetical protein [Metabacillus fastidiosus]MED4402463.1 hypothetical protein [Metabacillus fastidiosus]MED4453814.1 hypothetical protein [Metabacillus fastidiosus]MED4461750.1 hypothetical protein [Metabacillus fastidiosus]
MTQQELVCKSCGSESFTKGEMSGYANIRPIDKIFTNGSPVIFTFCKNCGEVASIKIKNTKKF